MKMIATKILTTNEPSFLERAARISVGAVLIGSVFIAGDYPLGWLALLPLLGIYPLYSGLTGATSLHRLSANNPAVYRLALSGASATLIGSVFLIGTTPLGGFALLPLIGSYIALCALFGCSPLAAIIDANAMLPYIVSPPDESVSSPDESITTPDSSAVVSKAA